MGCSQKNSIFSKNVEKELGQLLFAGTTGYIGSVLPGGTLEQTLTLNAKGGEGIKSIAGSISTTDPIAFKGGNFPGSGGTCGTSLSANESCTVVLTYKPTTTDFHKADIIIAYNNTHQDKTYTYHVTADSYPDLMFEFGLSYDFGNKFLNTQNDLRIRITNHGKNTTNNISVNNLSAPYSFKGGAYPGTGGTCSTQLATGATCDIVIRYLPTTRVQHLQNITLTYNKGAGTEQSSLSLAGWGFKEASLCLYDTGTSKCVTSTVNFDWSTIPNNTNSATKTLTVKYVDGDVKANSITLDSIIAPFKILTNNCSAGLSSGTCTLDVVTNSTSSGTWSNTVKLSFHSGLQTTRTEQALLKAITKELPSLTFSPVGNIDFGIVKKNSGTSSKTFTITYVSGDSNASSLAFSTLSSPFRYKGGTYPGTGGTCPVSKILSSGSCTLVVEFAPTSNYVWSQSTTISYLDIVTTKNSSSIVLKGSSEGLLAQYPGDANNAFGSVVVGVTKTQKITIYNSNGAAITNLGKQSISGPFDFAGGSFPGTGGTCTSSLATSASCTIAIAFTPDAETTFNSTVVLSYFNAIETTSLTINLSGKGAPAANLSVESMDFGTTPRNSQIAGPALIKVTNSGSVTATSVSYSLPTGFSFRDTNSTAPGTGGTCTSSLAGNASCTLNVWFTPTTTATFNGTLSVSYNNGAMTKTATSTLSGVSTDTADLFLDNYGKGLTFSSSIVVGSSQDLTIKLSHGGSVTAASSINISTDSSNFIIQTNPCTTTIANGTSCTITVRFKPLTGGGAKSGNLLVSYDSGAGTVNLSRSLTGGSLTPSLLTISPTSYDFGTISTNSVAEKTFTVTKTGEYSLYVFNVSITALKAPFRFKGNSYPGTGGTCPTSTLSTYNGSCTVVVEYNPTTINNFSDTLKFSYFNGTASGVIASSTLSGNAKGTLTFSASNFGQVIQTLTKDLTITVTNTDTNNATSLSSAALSAPFSYKGGSFPGTGGTCGATLNANGATCKLVVTYAPTAVNIDSQSVVFTYDDARVNNATATLNLSGEGVAQAILVMSEANTYDFGTAKINSSIQKLFSVTNSGGVAATSIAGTFSNAVFSFYGGSFPGTGGSCTTSLSPGTTCTIVLNFKPTAATSYNELFSLTYNDGIRTQTEPKNLSGSGSVNLNQAYYLSLIEKKSFSSTDLDSFQSEPIELSDINHNGYEDKLLSAMRRQRHSWVSYVAIDGRNNRQLFLVYNFLMKPFIQGADAVLLEEDLNHDGTPEILLGIYQQVDEHYELTGFDIICGKSGKVLKRFLP